MWNRRKNRIADLEARLEVALRSRSKTDDDSITAELRAHLLKAKADLRTTEAQLGAARRRIDRLNGSLATTQQRITTSEQARTELAFLIAEHITRGSSIEVLRKRVEGLGHAEIVDHMTRLIGGLDAEHAAIDTARAPAVTAGEVSA